VIVNWLIVNGLNGIAKIAKVLLLLHLRHIVKAHVPHSANLSAKIVIIHLHVRDLLLKLICVVLEKRRLFLLQDRLLHSIEVE